MKKTKLICYVLVFTVLILPLNSITVIAVKKPSVEWSKTIGTPTADAGSFVQQTTDGGYILFGTTGNDNMGGDTDYYLVKTNSLGEILWEKTYGGEKHELGRSARQTSDGGFILAGISNSFIPDSTVVYLVKTDSAGNLEWENIYYGGGAVSSTNRGWRVCCCRKCRTCC